VFVYVVLIVVRVLDLYLLVLLLVLFLLHVNHLLHLHLLLHLHGTFRSILLDHFHHLSLIVSCIVVLRAS